MSTLNDFADLHAVNRNEAERRWKSGFIAGKRASGTRRSPVELSAKGEHDFWIQFHETTGFRACDQCPHTGK